MWPESQSPRTKTNQRCRCRCLFLDRFAALHTFFFLWLVPIGSLNDFRRSVFGIWPIFDGMARRVGILQPCSHTPMSYSQLEVRTSSRHSQLIIALACWSNRICFAKDTRELLSEKGGMGQGEKAKTSLWRGCTPRKRNIYSTRKLFGLIYN